MTHPIERERLWREANKHRDVPSATGSPYYEMGRRSQMVALDPEHPNSKTRVVSIAHVRLDYTPRIQREAVDVFIRDELPGLLAAALRLAWNEGQFGHDDPGDATFIAAKIAKLHNFEKEK